MGKIKEKKVRRVSHERVRIEKSPVPWHSSFLNKIPSTTNANEILWFIDNNEITNDYYKAIKMVSKCNDETISNWFDVNVKTYRNYILHSVDLGKQKQEHAVMLLTLFKHGANVFGSEDKLVEWLNKGNFFFGRKKPIEYFDTISGIKYVDDRLTAMEYGDNV